MKNKPQSTSRPQKKTKSVLKKSPVVKAAFSGKKKNQQKKQAKNKIETPDNDNPRNIERELRETKERLRLLSEAAEEGIAVHHNGVIIDANDALARLFGYELSEIIGMQAERLATPESWKVIQKHISRKYDRPYEGVGIRKDGSTFICSLVGKPYKYKGRTLRLSTFNDITERKRVEDELRQEEQRFKALAEQSSDIIVFVNREGFVTYENPAVEKLLGLKPEERIGVNVFDRIHPDDLKCASNAFNTFTLNTPSKDINSPVREIRLRHQDGSWRTFETAASKLLHNNIVEAVMINLRDITERKQAEAQRDVALKVLMESESRFRAQYNGNPIPTFTWLKQGDEFILKDFNDSAKIFTTEQRNSFLGRPASEMYRNRREILGNLKRCYNEKRIIRIESISEHFMPGRFVVITFVFVLPDLVMVHMEDITERKQAEAALQESESRFRAFMDNMPSMVIIKDKGLKPLFFNRKFSEMFPANEWLGKIPEETFPSEIADSMRKNDLKALSEGFVTYEEDWRDKGGSLRVLETRKFSIDQKDKAPFLGVIITDITERKKAEKDLQNSEELFRNLFQYHSAVKLIVDLDTGKIIDANEAAVNYYGWPHEQLTRMKIQDISTLSHEEVKAAIKKVQTRKSTRFEFQHRRADGSVRDVEVFSSKIKAQGKDILHTIVHDITERKQAEEELKKYHFHLEELVRERTIKLEASNKELEAFSYSASHDLRAPLRTIDGFSQALLEDCEDKLDIQGKDYLIRIRAATRHMAELIDDLLQLSQITRTEINIEKINLTRIARFVIDELQKSQPQRHVEIKIADDLEDTADSKLMRIVLENLLGNAWKFTEKQAKAVIEFGLTKEGKKKVYFIRDNGAGFDMAYADKLFAPFQRLHTEEEFPGTGIGLALVQRIIHRHGGKVWVVGETGKGAIFYFNLNEK